VSNGLSVYGGSVRVVAAEHEIHRVASHLATVERLLLVAIETCQVKLALTPSISHLVFLAHSPFWLGRLRYLQFCLWVSGQSYFSTEARVRNLMHELMPDLSQALASGIAPPVLSTKEFSTAAIGAAAETSAPSSLRAMMNRLENTAVLADGTIRIESWTAGGQRHFLVYLAGTQDWTPISGSNPLNLASDFQAFANSKSDSQTAVLLALKKVGAKPGDDVMFVAHSQGGLVAADFAQNPSGYRVSSILSFAAPMVAIGAISTTKVLAFEHVNDPMPYLAGQANPLAANWVTVQAKATEGGIAAHALKSYGAMTSLADKSENVAIVKNRDAILKKLRGRQVKVQLIKVKRKPN